MVIVAHAAMVLVGIAILAVGGFAWIAGVIDPDQSSVSQWLHALLGIVGFAALVAAEMWLWGLV